MTNTSDKRPAQENAMEGSASCLENHFLIAMPQLSDPNFNGSVTYLWKHDEQGAMGLVINKPSRLSVPDLMKELKIDMDDSVAQRLGEARILTGGPVEPGKGFILHNAGTEWDYTMPVTEDISLTMSRDILADIAAGGGPDRYLIALGCAGWDAGQLEDEVADNAWLTVPADPDLLFSDDYSNKAAAAAALLGVSLGQLSSLTGHS